MSSSGVMSVATKTAALLEAIELLPEVSIGQDAKRAYIRAVGLECVQRIRNCIFRSIGDLNNGKTTIRGSVLGSSFTLLDTDRLISVDFLLSPGESKRDDYGVIIDGIIDVMSECEILQPLIALGYRVKAVKNEQLHGTAGTCIALVFSGVK